MTHLSSKPVHDLYTEQSSTFLSRKCKIAELATYMSLRGSAYEAFGKFGLVHTAKWGLESEVPVFDEEVGYIRVFNLFEYDVLKLRSDWLSVSGKRGHAVRGLELSGSA